jgi:hypothetical protein
MNHLVHVQIIDCPFPYIVVKGEEGCHEKYEYADENSNYNLTVSQGLPPKIFKDNWIDD